MSGARIRVAPDLRTGADLADTQQQSHGGPDLPLHVDRIGELAPGEACLLVREGAGTGFAIHDDAIVGRHPGCDVVLGDITVSRRHAEFRRFGDVFQVTDLGSLNGTYVNGERVDDMVLTPGDELQIGKFRFVFLANL